MARSEKQHAEAAQDPVEHREDPHRRRKRQRREDRPQRVENAGVGIGKQRPPPGHGVPPDRQASPAPGVVHDVFERDVVRNDVPPHEGAARQQRVRVRHEHEGREEDSRKKPPEARLDVDVHKRFHERASSAGLPQQQDRGGEREEHRPPSRKREARDLLPPFDLVRVRGRGAARRRRAAPARPSSSLRRRGSRGTARSPATRRARSGRGSPWRGPAAPGSSREPRGVPAAPPRPRGLRSRRRLRPGERAGSARRASTRPGSSRQRFEETHVRKRLRVLVPVAASGPRRTARSRAAAAGPGSGCRIAARGRRRSAPEDASAAKPDARRRLLIRERSPRSGSRLSTVPRCQSAGVAQYQACRSDSIRYGSPNGTARAATGER